MCHLVLLLWRNFFVFGKDGEQLVVLQQQLSFVVPLLLLGKGNKDKKLQEEIARFFVNVFVCVSVDMVLSSSLQWLLLFQVMQQKKYALVNTTRGTRRHSYFFVGAMKERVAIFQHKSLLLENCKKNKLLVCWVVICSFPSWQQGSLPPLPPLVIVVYFVVVYVVVVACSFIPSWFY